MSGAWRDSNPRTLIFSQMSYQLDDSPMCGPAEIRTLTRPVMSRQRSPLRHGSTMAIDHTIRLPRSSAASGYGPDSHQGHHALALPWFRVEGSNLHQLGQSQPSCRLNEPGSIFCCERGRCRTCDLLGKGQLLSRLSYAPSFCCLLPVRHLHSFCSLFFASLHKTQRHPYR